MNHTKLSTMEDVQNRYDHRQIAIDQVGVTDLRYPIVVLDRERQTQHTVASFTMSVSLPHHFKGTHMSRFIEVLNQHCDKVTMETLPDILADLQARLDAESTKLEVRFPYFLERIAPVSEARSLMEYECFFVAEANGENHDVVLGVKVPVTSLCPCSKTISEYGAHSQRGHLTIEIQSVAQRDGEETPVVWIEELVEIAEQSASSPLYSLLKRDDERHVTMLAYDNPVFVEDMVRNVASTLIEDVRIAWFCVHAVNQESIHAHNAFAKIEWNRSSQSKRYR